MDASEQPAIEHGSLRYREKIQRERAIAIRAACEYLAPGCGITALRRLFDHRATSSDIAHWRSGRRSAPAWAVELLQIKIDMKCERGAQIRDQIKTGPGSAQAGTEALRRWRAKRRATE